jgi:hypothetical protein
MKLTTIEQWRSAFWFLGYFFAMVANVFFTLMVGDSLDPSAARTILGLLTGVALWIGIGGGIIFAVRAFVTGRGSLSTALALCLITTTGLLLRAAAAVVAIGNLLGPEVAWDISLWSMIFFFIGLSLIAVWASMGVLWFRRGPEVQPV